MKIDEIELGSLVSDPNGVLGIVIETKLKEEGTNIKIIYGSDKQVIQEGKYISFKVKWFGYPTIYDYNSLYPIHKWKLLSKGNSVVF